jgi:hypothetical protein
MNTASHRSGGTCSRIASTLKRAYSSYWFERILFIAGSLLLFASEQILTNKLDEARDDLAYFDRNIAQTQSVSASRSHWLAEYNRAVVMRPQVRELVAQAAFDLFANTDQLLSLLRGIVEQDGRGEVLSILQEKNERRAAAARELVNGDAEALVERVNKIHPEYEAQVEPLTGRLMLKRLAAQSEESKWSGRVKSARLLGSLLLAAAFGLREVKDYYKRTEAKQAEAGSQKKKRRT